MLALYRRLSLVFFLLLTAIVICIYIVNLKFVLDNQFFIDDSYIYLRFARNFVQGFGLVWNRGEYPVEGFTSILYLGLLIITEKIGGSSLTFMPILGVVFTFITFVLSWHLGKILNPGHELESLFAVDLIGLSLIFLFWSATGMEMPLYTALLMTSALLYIGYQRRKSPTWLVGIVFAVTALSRPEGLVIFGITFLFDILSAVIWRKPILDKNLLYLALSFILVYMPIFVWKWSYFGYPFPNTYYAKTDGISFVQIAGGMKYFISNLPYILSIVGVPLLFALLNIRKVREVKDFSVERVYIAVLIISSLGIVILNGGDHFARGRFLMPIIPLLVVLSIVVFYSDFLDNFIKLKNIKPIFLLIPLIVTACYNQPWSIISPHHYETKIPKANPKRFKYFDNWDVGFVVMGKTLKNIASENESIAVVPIGAIGYYSDMVVIDMVGLVDPVIAHEPFDPFYVSTWRPGHDKGDGAYILSRHPDYIQFIGLLTSQPLPGLDEYARQIKSINEIWESPNFHANYEFYPIKTEGGWYYNLYRKIGKNN